ncbi:hypothetical protein CLOP_g10891 [Closterium sp. NIES-67]|nr:hypothetical protein CLOP_g22610 [Closterium sp. NIES-67]GJP80690.1 hypothetical protein CLOP_g10891 [Closterium sp. NIES-67]
MQELQPLQAPVLRLRLHPLNINNFNFFNNSSKRKNSFSNNNNNNINSNNSNRNSSFCSSSRLLSLVLSFKHRIF